MGVADKGEGYAYVEEGTIQRKHLFLPFNFYVNLQLLKKKNHNLEKNLWLDLRAH